MKTIILNQINTYIPSLTNEDIATIICLIMNDISVCHEFGCRLIEFICNNGIRIYIHIMFEIGKITLLSIYVFYKLREEYIDIEDLKNTLSSSIDYLINKINLEIEYEYELSKIILPKFW